MKIVGKIVESIHKDVCYFTDGTALSCDHDGMMSTMSAKEVQEYHVWNNMSKPQPGTDDDV